MLTHPTLDLLHELGLSGMASGFKAPKTTKRLPMRSEPKSLD